MFLAKFLLYQVPIQFSLPCFFYHFPLKNILFWIIPTTGTILAQAIFYTNGRITIIIPIVTLNNIRQILQGHSLNIKIYPLEVSNIQRGATELNIISTRVDKSYIQQIWACYICFIICLLTFF